MPMPLYDKNLNPNRSEYQPRHIGDMVVSQVTKEPNNFFTVRSQLRSLAFGLGCGGAFIMLFLFIAFNEIVITPFIKPSQAVAQVPLADQAGLPTDLLDPTPKIRISKINVEIPVIYGLTSTDEKQFELALDQGVVHYPTTVLPGQAGNTAFFGHSSNNIFNPGKYKFAFLLLHQLTPQDTFSLTREGVAYEYQVISSRVVKPTEIGVLGAVPGQVATATLITCDPPGTSTNRLVVVGKQISPGLMGTDLAKAPDPATVSAVPPSGDLPGNGPGLLTRVWRSIF